MLDRVVLVAGVGFGRQVLRWWAADGAVRGRTATPLADDAWAIPPSRTTSGSATNRSRCGGKRSPAIGPPPTPPCWPAAAVWLQSAPAGAAAAATGRPGADRALLEALQRLRPAAEEPGKWRLYDLPEASPGRRHPGGRAADPSDAQAQLAEPTPRAVIWGLAIPLAAKVWTLYTFQPDADAAGADSGVANIPIPPGSGRIVSMQVSQGGVITAFSGPDRTDQWRRFYDGWFGRHGWKAAGAWQQTGSSWLLRCTARTPGGRRWPTSGSVLTDKANARDC